MLTDIITSWIKKNVGEYSYYDDDDDPVANKTI